MMINKVSKGTTLVEVMLSVALISIVLIFIFGILVDLKNENNATKNRGIDSVNKSAAIRIIQNDLINYQLNNFKSCDASQYTESKEVCYILGFAAAGSEDKMLKVGNGDNGSYIIYGTPEYEKDGEKVEAVLEKWGFNNNGRFIINKSSSLEKGLEFRYKITDNYFAYVYLHIPFKTTVSNNTNKNMDFELMYSSDNAFKDTDINAYCEDLYRGTSDISKCNE